mmetsp:Transcript_21591/g.50819  ORF Transcript_21591/g.50819 Transcript_21591/m.50819 type:complete len:244 (-) Transcript_21591:421-1152(-)
MSSPSPVWMTSALPTSCLLKARKSRLSRWSSRPEAPWVSKVHPKANWRLSLATPRPSQTTFLLLWIPTIPFSRVCRTSSALRGRWSRSGTSLPEFGWTVETWRTCPRRPAKCSRMQKKSSASMGWATTRSLHPTTSTRTLCTRSTPRGMRWTRSALAPIWSPARASLPSVLCISSWSWTASLASRSPTHLPRCRFLVAKTRGACTQPTGRRSPMCSSTLAPTAHNRGVASCAGTRSSPPSVCT